MERKITCLGDAPSIPLRSNRTTDDSHPAIKVENVAQGIPDAARKAKRKRDAVEESSAIPIREGPNNPTPPGRRAEIHSYARRRGRGPLAALFGRGDLLFAALGRRAIIRTPSRWVAETERTEIARLSRPGPAVTEALERNSSGGSREESRLFRRGPHIFATPANSAASAVLIFTTRHRVDES